MYFMLFTQQVWVPCGDYYPSMCRIESKFTGKSEGSLIVSVMSSPNYQHRAAQSADTPNSTEGCTSLRAVEGACPGLLHCQWSFSCNFQMPLVRLVVATGPYHPRILIRGAMHLYILVDCELPPDTISRVYQAIAPRMYYLPSC